MGEFAEDDGPPSSVRSRQKRHIQIFVLCLFLTLFNLRGIELRTVGEWASFQRSAFGPNPQLRRMASLPKIRRDAAPPSFERRGRDAVPIRHELSGVLSGYSVKFGRGRWERPFEFFESGEDGFLRWRKTQAFVEQHKRLVGALEFVEYDAAVGDGRDFFDAMDAESYEMMRAASVLLSEWRDLPEDVLNYGRVVEIAWVWAEPAHDRPGIWIPVLEALLGRVERFTAAVIAMAFPLEYEGKVPAGDPTRPAFERRRRAMLRYYKQKLGLESLPGPPGQGGWMWRPGAYVKDVVRKPRYRRGWYQP